MDLADRPARASRPVASVDPAEPRPMLFLDAARQMMVSSDWWHRAVTAVIESHGGPGRFAFYGASHPDAIEDVHTRHIDMSTLNRPHADHGASRGRGVRILQFCRRSCNSPVLRGADSPASTISLLKSAGSRPHYS
jgi:hypothetical protein